jgi:addiction module HigA family antidote
MAIPKERIATHPGEVLLQQYIKPLGLTQAALAKELEISTNRLNELVRGKRGSPPIQLYDLPADSIRRLSFG